MSTSSRKISFLLTLVIGISVSLGSPALFAATLYVTSSSANQIMAYTINSSTGMLSHLNIGSVTTGFEPNTILAVKNKNLYVGNKQSSNIFMYAIEPDMKLKPLTEASISTPIAPSWLTTDPSDTYFYNTNYASNSVSQYKTSETGELKPLALPTVSAGTEPMSIVFDPLGTPFAYVTNYANYSIGIYHFNASTGQLSLQSDDTLSYGGPVGIAFDHAHHAYVINYDNMTITMYYADPVTGVLSALNPASVKTGMHQEAIAVDNSGKYVYVTAYSENMIYMYKIGKNGVLEPLNPVKTGTGYGPRAIALDNADHLYVTDTLESAISMYQIDPDTGLLTALSPAKLTTDHVPTEATVVN